MSPNLFLPSSRRPLEQLTFIFFSSSSQASLGVGWEEERLSWNLTSLSGLESKLPVIRFQKLKASENYLHSRFYQNSKHMGVHVLTNKKHSTITLSHFYMDNAPLAQLSIFPFVSGSFFSVSFTVPFTVSFTVLELQSWGTIWSSQLCQRGFEGGREN